MKRSTFKTVMKELLFFTGIVFFFFQICATTKRDKDITSGLLAVCLTHWALAVVQSGVTSFL